MATTPFVFQADSGQTLNVRFEAGVGGTGTPAASYTATEKTTAKGWYDINITQALVNSFFWHAQDAAANVVANGITFLADDTIVYFGYDPISKTGFASASPSAADIAAEVNAPTAVQIAAEVNAPTAVQIAAEVAAPTAAAIAAEVNAPTAAAIAAEVNAPTAAAIVDLVLEALISDHSSVAGSLAAFILLTKDQAIIAAQNTQP